MSELKPELWAVELGNGMGVIRLGATGEELVRSLEEAGIEFEMDGEDLSSAYLDDLDTELKFKSTSPPVLLEIEVWDERVRLGPLPVIGERLHAIVDQLHVTDAETLWKIGKDGEGPQPFERVVTDDELLSEGTLWIPSLGLGLVMMRGEIAAVRLRKPDDSPRRGIGTLTAAQRGLSARGDLLSHLYRPRAGGGPKGSWFQTLLGLALVVAIGLLVWQAVNYQLRWNAAPAVEGNVVEVRPPPPDPFPTEYTIAYRDQANQPHQVVLKRMDVYVTPHVGDKLEIRFLPEAPDEALGPARYGDIAFEKFIPWGIGVVAAYLAIQTIVSVAGLVMRR